MSEAETPSILLVKRGSIKSSDKGRLTKIGVAVVEVDYPADCKFIKPSIVEQVAELSHGELLTAAATTFTRLGGSSNQYFGEEVAKAIVKRALQSPAGRGVMGSQDNG